MRSFRYAIILVLFALGTGLAAVAGWRYGRTSTPVSGPILIISVDALRTDRLGAYGGTHVPTPAIDRLAADGIVFDRAYTHTPQTLPAHAALLSGRLPFETGVRDEVGHALSLDERPLARVLSERGYETAAIVSSFALRRKTGLANGFTLYDDELPESTDGVPTVHRDGGESERRAERWLSAVATTRAFLFLHLDEPRAPYAPPSRFSAHAPYDGEVAYVDEILGRLIGYLEKQQLYDQATIVLVADHGESLEVGNTSGEPGHGVLVSEETVRVPLIVKLPAGEGAGQRVNDLVQLVDLAPTILDLARAPVPRGLRGRTLEPLLKGRRLEARMAYSESLFAARQFGLSPIVSLTDGRYRYVRASSESLYDLRTDAAATVDIASTEPALTAQFRTELAQIVGENDISSRMDPASAGLSREEREHFEALGFLGPRDASIGAPGQPDVDPQGKLEVMSGYRQAVRPLTAREWAPALDMLRTVCRHEPGMLDLWTSLARVAERAERHDIAIDAYRHILGQRADLIQAHLGLAAVLMKVRRFEEARQQAELVSRDVGAARDHSAGAHALLARVAVATTNPGSAHVHAQRAAELNPSSPVPAFIEGQLLFERGRFDDALLYLDQAAALVADSTSGVEDVHYLRGETLLRLDRQAEAEAALLQEIAVVPESSKARAALVTLYHAQGRMDEAVETVTALTRVVSTPSAYSAAARLWTVLGDPGRAAAARAEGRRALATTRSTRVSAQ